MQNKKEEQEYMLPKNDYVFKKLFGNEGNEDITKNLVSNIIGQSIKKLELKNPQLLREDKNDKEEILDIKALLDNNVQCDIEIQVGNYHDVEKRILDYWAKMYRMSLGKSNKYINMKRTIVIFITTFDIDKLKGIEQYKTKWQIYEEKLKIKLTDVFEVDIIELSKAKRQLKKGTFKEEKTLKEWVKFLINPKELEETKMEDLKEEVKKAYDLWKDLNQNEEEREAAERRFLELNSRLYAQEYERKLGKAEGREEGREEGRKEGREEGRKEGREEGRKEGREEGKTEKQKEIAKKMLIKGIDTNTIIELTGLSEEQIQKLQN